MKKKLIRMIYPLMVAIGMITALSACKNSLDIKPEVMVDASNTYQTTSDADAAVMGVYSGVLNVAAQYVVLNEVRADLLDVTTNGNEALQAINNHQNDVASQNDPKTGLSNDMGYADPKPFYTVILNCNDVLKNLTNMRLKFLLTADEYNERYSDIMAVRCWLYLQLAVHYGQIPYITKPFEKISDLKDSLNFPKMDLATVIDTLIYEMINIPYLDNYSTSTTLMGISSGTYNTTPFFINKRILLGDLYLWHGDYFKAASSYKMVLDYPSVTDLQTYRMAFADVVYHNDLAIGYWQRYQPNDINGLINSDTYGWRSIFCRTQDKYYYQEWIWQLFYDNANKSSSPFIDLFANYGQGKYLLKPSQEVIDLWNSQTQNNGFPYDARGTLSYTMSNGQPIVMKYLYEYNQLTPYKKPGRVFLYRATGLYLHYMEAANRDNRCKLALALLNRGIHTEFSPYRDYSQGHDTVADLTQIQRTDGSVYNYSFPYDFDGRQDEAPFYYNSVRLKKAGTLDSIHSILISQYPVGIRGTWSQCVGVRGHANVKPVLGSIYNPTAITLDNSDAMKDSIEQYVIQEDALELAFEGERWSDLLRVAIRRNDPSFLADKVYLKLLKEGNPNAITVKNNLLARKWFLPFKFNQ